MNGKLKMIINHYGVNAQQRQLAEEVFELQEAIIQYEEPRRYHSKEHIAEEIADCYVMIEQFRLYYGISSEELKKIMQYKIDRQIKRIEDDKR